MPAGQVGGKSDIGKVVEKQMRNWELARAQKVEPTPGEAPREVQDFVTISRTAGSRGWDVAALLGERLGWPVFDRQILQAMAGDDQVRARLYDHMDERDVSWLEATVRWIIHGEFRREDYFHCLTETVLALARQGPAIFVGRAADLILPRQRGLRVRITAPLERRAREFALENGVSEALGRAEVERIDREREEFRRRYFGLTANALTCYDMALTLDRFTPAQAGELILAALRVRGIIT